MFSIFKRIKALEEKVATLEKRLPPLPNVGGPTPPAPPAPK